MSCAILCQKSSIALNRLVTLSIIHRGINWLTMRKSLLIWLFSVPSGHSNWKEWVSLYAHWKPIWRYTQRKACFSWDFSFMFRWFSFEVRDFTFFPHIFSWPEVRSPITWCSVNWMPSKCFGCRQLAYVESTLQCKKAFVTPNHDTCSLLLRTAALFARILLEILNFVWITAL